MKHYCMLKPIFNYLHNFLIAYLSGQLNLLLLILHYLALLHILLTNLLILQSVVQDLFFASITIIFIFQNYNISIYQKTKQDQINFKILSQLEDLKHFYIVFQLLYIFSINLSTKVVNIDLHCNKETYTHLSP